MAGSTVDNSHETQAGFENEECKDLTRGGGGCGRLGWLLRACDIAGKGERNDS